MTYLNYIKIIDQLMCHNSEILFLNNKNNISTIFLTLNINAIYKIYVKI